MEPDIHPAVLPESPKIMHLKLISIMAVVLPAPVVLFYILEPAELVRKKSRKEKEVNTVAALPDFMLF